MEVSLRPLVDADVLAVQIGLYNAVTWNQPDAPPLEVAVHHPQLKVYWEGWGRPGDMGVVAESERESIGAAFARLFRSRDESDGFVDPSVPELGIGIVPGYRSRGIGRSLMEALHDEARGHGFDRLSLSVHLTNPAVDLYKSLGYEELDRDTKSARMIKTLSRAE